MNLDEHQTPPEDFVLLDDNQSAPEAAAALTPAATRFSVVPHLILVAFILVGLFSTIIVPKAISSLSAAPETPREIIPLPDIATVTASFDPFSEVSLAAEAAYVWDISNQRSLFAKNSEVALPLASITKLMTALVSYELITDDTIVTVSEEAAKQESGGFFLAGEQFKAKDLADFSLISSYNSAAYTLADSVGALLGSGDPTNQFVAAMNVTADELGLTSLEFFNPTGLDVSATKSGAYGSAAEVSRLMEYIVKNYPEILIPTITPHKVLYNTAGYTHEADNTNDIIRDIPNVLGSKTGYTDLAGGNLTVVFDAGFNRYIIITVLGSTRSARFADMKKLIDATTASLATP